MFLYNFHLPFKNGRKQSLVKRYTIFLFPSPLFLQQISNIKIKMKIWCPNSFEKHFIYIRKETAE